jgi:anthranilate/para-aminobenzoate synthase component II
MILLISICDDELHKLEFVSPIEDVLKNNKIKFRTVDYRKIKKSDLQDCKKAIICGTSLADNVFLENFGKFAWVKKFNKPLLGICGGMQIIGLSFRCKLKKFRQIGLVKLRIKKNNLIKEKEIQGYNLHNYCLIVNKRDFEIISSNKCAQFIKHKEKPIYGMIFHPEVRNKKIIEDFVK